MSNIDAVVFDLDDTLYDEIDYVKSGFKAVSQRLSELSDSVGAESVFDMLWEEFRIGNRRRVFNHAVAQAGICEGQDCSALIGGLVRLYREHKPEIALPEESRMVLEALRGEYKLGLLTDGFLPAQRLKVEALGVGKYFEAIVYTEELGRKYWKPAVAGFEKLSRELGTEPTRMVYVADNEQKDFIGPNKLGFVTIQVLRENQVHTGKSSDEFAKADHRVSAAGQLPELLNRLG